MAIDFREEEINEMYGMYQQALEAINEEALQAVSSLAEKAEEVHYEPVVTLSKRAVEYYNEDLRGVVLGAMQEWQEGESSFTAFMEKMRAGDDAKARSEQLETQIVDEVENWPRADASGFESIDTSNPTCRMDDFEEIKATISSFVKSLEDMQTNYASQVETRMEDNTIFTCIQPVLLGSFMVVSEGFQQGIDQSFAELAREFDEREQEAQRMGQSAAESVASQSRKLVSEGVEAIQGTVRTIFE